MNGNAKLISDNGAHKCLINKDGKQLKITIANTKDMTFIEANEKIIEINVLLESNYSFYELKLLYNFSKEACNISRFSSKSIEIVMKIMYQEQLKEEIKEEKEVIEKPLKVLNIGNTGAGKSLFNLSVSLQKYIRIFSSLTSIKESTNFPIKYVVNNKEKKLKNLDEFEVEISLKSEEEFFANIQLLNLEAIKELFDTIQQEVSKENNVEIKNYNEIWKLAIEKALKRLKVDKLKTFVITYLISTDELANTFEDMIFSGIKKYFVKSNSYNSILTSEIMKENIIDEIKRNNIKFEIDKITDIYFDMDEFKHIVDIIKDKLEFVKGKFCSKYGLDLKYDSIVTIRKSLNDSQAKDIIDNIFGNKKRRSEQEFFSIEVFIRSAVIYVQNKEVNKGKEVQLFDGVGINQGDIKNGQKIQMVQNRIGSAIQKCNPDIIIYHSLINAKDDYIINTLEMLSQQGYSNNISVVYGRLDTTLVDYCNEEGIDFPEEFDKSDFDKFKSYIQNEYLNEESISVNNIIGDNLYLCDKTCKILNTIKDEYYSEYTPKFVLNQIICKYNNSNNNRSLNLKIEECINIMDKCYIFGNIYNLLMDRWLDDNIPMQYSKLRWNTLECGIRKLSLNQNGCECLYPSITLRNYFAQFLNNDLLKLFLEEDYNIVIKNLLYEWTEYMHIIMVTSYKFEYLNLLRIRYDKSKRKMLYMTMTDERKYTLRDIYSKCLGIDEINIISNLRFITRCVLNKILVNAN